MVADRQSQANIPEGMIPQEVVARNRNRFLHNKIPRKNNSESKPEVKNESPTKDDDSDDGYKNFISNRIVQYYILRQLKNNKICIVQN